MKSKLAAYLRKKASPVGLPLAVAGLASAIAGRLGHVYGDIKNWKSINKYLEHQEKMGESAANSLKWGLGGLGVGGAAHLAGKAISSENKKKKEKLKKKADFGEILLPGLGMAVGALGTRYGYQAHKGSKELDKAMAEEAKSFGKLNSGAKVVGGIGLGLGAASLFSKIKKKLEDKDED
jgi:hypothetical protein